MTFCAGFFEQDNKRKKHDEAFMPFWLNIDSRLFVPIKARSIRVKQAVFEGLKKVRRPILIFGEPRPIFVKGR